MSGNAAAAVLTKPAFRKIEWLARDIAVERRPDGVIVDDMMRTNVPNVFAAGAVVETMQAIAGVPVPR